jgi:hypothetical protein
MDFELWIFISLKPSSDKGKGCIIQKTTSKIFSFPNSMKFWVSKILRPTPSGKSINILSFALYIPKLFLLI